MRQVILRSFTIKSGAIDVFEDNIEEIMNENVCQNHPDTADVLDNDDNNNTKKITKIKKIAILTILWLMIKM